MIIDFHHHLLEEPTYVDTLLTEMDKAGIDICCINGLGVGRGQTAHWDLSRFNLGVLSPGNEDVAPVIRRHPDRLVGLGVVKLGSDGAEAVERLRGEGFLGLKIARSSIDYDHDSCMPVYEMAQRLKMPILFHTGMQLITPFDGEDDVSSAHMRPILLDRVARRFPDLKMVMAHLGMPWHEEAAMMARFHPNVYADLTGGRLGWRNRLSPSDYHRLFYWEGSFDKLVFGTDTHARDIHGALYDQELLFDQLNLGKETKEKILYRNAQNLLGLG